MANLLIIDTSGPTGYVALAHGPTVVASQYSMQAQEHASFVQPAIESLLQQTGYHFSQINAITVVNGPGSYTGLRVGLASAKGLCFALNIPLITLPTLQVMAMAASTQVPDAWQCPMIDARRMEVFFALYDTRHSLMQGPANAILDDNWLLESLTQHPICFSGSGSQKWRQICQHPHAIFIPQPSTLPAAAQLALRQYEQGNFANLVYATPFYIKDFYTPAAKA